MKDIRTVRRIIVLALSSLILISCVTTPATYTFLSQATGKQVGLAARGDALGDPKAPVVIEEYSDFQCPYCKTFAESVGPRILEDYVTKGRVRFVYHSFGNWVSRKAEGNTESMRTAEAAYFAADQNRFWQLHDLFFRLQGRPNSGVFSNEAIIDAAVRVGLDGARLTSSLESRRYAERAQKEYDEGIARGVTSTPTFFVNGLMIVGAQPYALFQSAIEDALSEAGQNPASANQ